ncbi:MULTISPECIES: saccharopine dehydrogenase NADP-binding domain-containing protein [unclassified Streptomyces]|uniref:saccharopine dehydrogenase NADP-binding domain-containing protein n=1 Tax=unclassified Streptomyces TaxID=2593676 RepID=UPI0034285AB5
MTGSRIGIVGGYGEVGASTARLLYGFGLGPLRIGGRDADAARRFAGTELSGADGRGRPAAEHAPVDFTDDASLDSFAAGCRVLVNCAGPSRLVGNRVARAALRAGADHVDVAGDEPLHALLDDGEWAGAGRAAVLSAGLQPGLTGLLPRWAAARDFDEVHRLSVYLCVRDLFTGTAAEDYLHAAAEGRTEMLAAWRDGARRSAASVRTARAELPFFPEPVALLPHLAPEAERLARALGLRDGDWYTALAGEQVGRAFDRVRTLPPAEAVAALRAASRLDLAGRAHFVRLVVSLDGVREGRPRSRTAVLRGRSNSGVSGAVAALAVLAALRGELPPGRHYAADVLDPGAALERLRSAGATAGLEGLTVVDGAYGEPVAVEEGIL